MRVLARTCGLGASGLGIRTVIAGSYADIFFNNCFKNGVLPIILPSADIDALFECNQASGPFSMDIDLDRQTATTDSGQVYRFEMDDFKKKCLLEGLDDIALTMQHEGDISAYEQRRMTEVPWLFQDLSR